MQTSTLLSLLLATFTLVNANPQASTDGSQRHFGLKDVLNSKDAANTNKAQAKAAANPPFDYGGTKIRGVNLG